MKGKIKILSLLLAVLILICPLGINAFADPPTEGIGTSDVSEEESDPAQELEDEPSLLKKILILINPDNWLPLLFTSLCRYICEGVGNLVDAITLAFGNDFFNIEYINEFLDFFYFLAWIILSVGFIKGLVTGMERSYHGEASLLDDLIKNFMIASGVILFARYGVLWANEMTVRLINDLTNVTLGSVWDAAAGFSGGLINSASRVWVLIVLIIIIVVSFNTLWTALKRCGVLLLQIVSGYFYAFDLASGNSGVLGEWVRDVASGCITFSLQMILYQIGMRYASDGLLRLFPSQGINNSSVIIGLAFLATAGSVSTIMRRWGYANQQGSGRMTQAAYLALSAARFLA